MIPRVKEIEKSHTKRFTPQQICGRSPTQEWIRWKLYNLATSQVHPSVTK